MIRALRLTFLAMCASCRVLVASTGTAQHSLHFTVPSVNVLSVINRSQFQYDVYPPFPGVTNSVVHDGNSQYSVTNNASTGRIITGRLTGELPEGIQVSVKLTPPGRAQSQRVLLSTTDQILVTEIGNGAYRDKQILYVVYADENAVQQQYEFEVGVIYTLMSSE